MALSTIAYLIIDAGGTFLKSAVLSPEGKVLPGSCLSVQSVSDGTKNEILDAFRKIISNGFDYAYKNKIIIAGIGIAFPGPFDIKKATSLMKHKFQAIYGVDLRESVYNSGGVPRIVTIHFVHDANSVLIGELWKGGAKGFKNAAVVTLGTGLGFALSKDGEVICNEIGGPYLSIFKIPYKNGTLEDYTAKRGFLKIYNELIGNSISREFSVADISELAGKGDIAAVNTFEEVGRILAENLQDILLKHNIECLLFSGQISKSFRYMEVALKNGLKNIACLKRVSAVANIDHAALMGTLKNLIDNLKFS